MICVHCGAALTTSNYRLNPWLVALECRPHCEAGAAWYAENTWKSCGYVMVRQDHEAAVREQKRGIHATKGAGSDRKGKE